MSRRSGTRIVPRRSKRGRRLTPRRVPVYRHNLVALEAADGDLVRTFRAAVNNRVAALAHAGGRLYVAGLFQTVGGRRRDGFAAVSAATGAPSAAFSPQPRSPLEGNAISAVLSDGARVFAAGRFSGFGDVPRPHFTMFPAAAAGAT